MAPDKARDKQPIDLVLCWHMHQPDYRDHRRDEYRFPWVYLHAVKDYADMAAHLEAAPRARAVVNFSPVLLQQLEDYSRMLEGFLKGGKALRDPLLEALAATVFPSDTNHRTALIKACLRANRKHMIEPYPAYRRLADIADLVIRDEGSAYVSHQYLADLLTWYHLVWLSESLLRSDPLAGELMAQGGGFSLHQRRQLLDLIARQIASLGPRYRRLAEDGRVELSVSPLGHPILPLLLDFGAAREALPDLPLPEHRRYPGGEARARWHIEEGLRVFQRFFGTRPEGCWPPEGAVSAAALKLLADAGFRWAATGEAVLRNSAAASGIEDDAPDPLYSAWSPADAGIRLYARNDGLSDLIGFSYADWDAEHAVEDLIEKIIAIGDAYTGKDGPVVSIIMDGENAWEYFPHNGWYFLNTLYSRLSEHPRIRLATYSSHLQAPAPKLKRIVAGSWVHGTLTTWIGSEDKNGAWDLLSDAKQLYDEVVARADVDEALNEALATQLAACEGSDWFWWFGDYNPAAAVSDFEYLYRLHLSNLYTLLQREPPPSLSRPLSQGRGQPGRGGVMRAGAPDATAS